MVKKSSCLEDDTIQLFIDNELDESTRKTVEMHLLSCGECAQKKNEMADWAIEVKRALRENAAGSFEFKELELSENRANKTLPRHRISPFLKIAALLIFILGGYFLLQKHKSFRPSSSDLMTWEETVVGNDANRAWHDRQITILITDKNGKISYLNVN